MNQRKTLILTGLVLVALISIAARPAMGFVLNIPKQAGVGSDPIKYSFDLGAGEEISFELHSENATIEASIIEIAAANHSIFSTSLYIGNDTTIIKSHNFAWTLNITINATASYTGSRIDFYAKYTFMKTSGNYLSWIVAGAAGVIGIVFLYALVSKRERAVEAKAS
jgi:hypothetical protein